MIKLDKTLLLIIQKDIEALKACDRGELDVEWGDLECELYGSINSSQYGFEISKEVADYLRAKYLGYDNGVEVEYYFKS